MRYRVRVGRRSSVIVRSNNPYNARKKAWDDIKNGFTYGWKNKSEFMRKVKVERLD